VEIRTKDEFRDVQAAQVDDALVVINVFLALALIIALVGIANTLALSVFERTREIGLLRAVGATRQQTSVLIRWEGAIIAVFGGLLGVVLGIVFGIIAVVVIPDSLVSEVALPGGQLAIYLVVAALAGLIAAYLPARRAARLNVLEAIALGE
jgi:putative ABC transport system permease protein